MAFDGAWKIERKEKNDKSMEKMGTVVQKKREAHNSLKVTISKEGDKLAVEVSERSTIQEETAWSKSSRAGASLKSVTHKSVYSVPRPAITD